MKNKPIKIGSYFFEKIFDSKIIKAGIQKVAKKISDDYRNSEPPILLFVTNGGMFLGVDLSRELEKNNLSCFVDIFSVEGYGPDNTQKNKVSITSTPKIDLTGREVIVVEDLVDRGDSLILVDKTLKKMNVRNVEYCVLASKKGHKELGFNVKYPILGLNLNLGWIVGMGMDSERFGRGLDGIYEKIS